VVYMLLAAGFEEMESFVPADLLRRAGIETVLVSTGGEYVTGGQGITVKADLLLEQADLDKAELVILLGGGVGVANLFEDTRAEAFVKEAAQREIPLAAICAAPTLLARWGLLEGKQAVCYPTWADRLVGAEYQEGEKLAVDGRFITGQAAGASFDFGLKLVELLAGAEKAQEVRRGIYYC